MGVNGIYGLSGSGLDIESMVKVGMMSKQSEYDKMAQKYTKNEWTKAAYLELNSSITTFNNSALSNYKYSSTMNAKGAEVSSGAVKVSANGSASLVNHQVEVVQLSSNASLISTVSPARYGGASSESMEIKSLVYKNITYDANTKKATGKSVNNLDFEVENADTKNAIEFVLKDGTKKDGVENEVVIGMTYAELANGATFNELVDKIKNSGLNVSASYDAVYDKFSIFNTETGADNKISIEIRSQNESLVKETTIYDVTRTREEHNIMIGATYYTYSDNAPGTERIPHDVSDKVYTNVVASTTSDFFNRWQLFQSKDGDLYQPNSDIKKSDAGSKYMQFSWGEKETTEYYTRTITTNAWDSSLYRDTGNVFASSDLTKNTHATAKSVSGQNAQIKIDGTLYDKVEDNKITVNGVTYTAVEKGTATVGVSQDVDAIVDKVKSFVEDYNKLLASLYEKYDEKPDSNYKPLTQSQKDAMKEDQITKWEEKAKKGLLYHDQTLGKIISEMRNTIANPIDGIDGKYNSVYSIGISTTGLKGQLKLDEDKLRAALAEDSEAVYNILSRPALEGKSWGDGVTQKLSSVLTNATKNIKTRAGSSADITEDSDLNNLLRNLQTKMSNFKKLMNSFEDALYKKYDAMESALARLGSQLNFVTSSFQ